MGREAGHGRLSDEITALVRPIVRANDHAPLGEVPFHGDLAQITRRCPDAFPIHVAVHEISAVERVPAEYTKPHVHQVPELNVLIAPPGRLVYRMLLDGREQEVVSPASVWIPAGVEHAANVVSGSGSFVCVLFGSTAEAFGEPDR